MSDQSIYQLIIAASALVYLTLIGLILKSEAPYGIKAFLALILTGLAIVVVGFTLLALVVTRH